MIKIRRSAFATILCVSCSFILFYLWVSDDAGYFYKFAFAPILLLQRFGNSSDVYGGISCYLDESKNSIDEISTTSNPPPKGNSIFFHETSCISSAKGVITLTARQACAVESAAKMNPHSEVNLLFTSPINVKNSTLSDSNIYVKQLLSYPNVRVRHLNFEQYFVGTPLEDWYLQGAIKESKYPRSHASDVLRFLTLWKFGGIYSDLDVVIIRSLSDLGNFAGAESGADVAAGILKFDSGGAGHQIVEDCLEDLRNEFRGDDWGNNGPGVITRVLKRWCHVKEVKNMNPKKCKGFTVLPPSAFYPIPWRQWRLYFDEKGSAQTMSRLSDSYAIHVWNRFSVAENITVGSKQPYGLIAAKYCPKVYSNCGKIF